MLSEACPERDFISYAKPENKPGVDLLKSWDIRT